MRLIHALLPALLVLAIAAPLQAADSRVVYWDDLRPALPDLENPFEALTDQQFEDMRTHVKWLTAPASVRADADREAEAEQALARLTGAGIDVEDLLKQRREIIRIRQKAATDPNPELLGQNVRIPGYVLPLSFEGRKVTEFLLVPTVGACIHTPAPAPNQVVHVTYPQGIEVEGLFAPVWVDGPLMAQSRTQKIGYSDGTTPVDSNYTLNAVKVEDYN